nr:unnamed protein product [Callosobruchus chinensis]
MGAIPKQAGKEKGINWNQLLKEVFGDNCMSRTRVFEWHKRFSEGREEVEDDERTGRPVTSRIEENIKKVNEIVRKDRRLSLRMISDLSNIDRETRNNNGDFNDQK